MLDAFIIDQIKKRERQHDDRRPQLELPLPSEPRPANESPAQEQEPEGERGVVIIDFA